MQLNIYEAKNKLSALVDAALAGEEVLIARHGKAEVRLTPVKTERRRELGFDRGLIWIAPDFDETPPELLAEFESSDL